MACIECTGADRGFIITLSHERTHDVDRSIRTDLTTALELLDHLMPRVDAPAAISHVRDCSVDDEEKRLVLARSIRSAAVAAEDVRPADLELEALVRAPAKGVGSDIDVLAARRDHGLADCRQGLGVIHGGLGVGVR